MRARHVHGHRGPVELPRRPGRLLCGDRRRVGGDSLRPRRVLGSRGDGVRRLRYTATEGQSACLPATPGSIVPLDGAFAEKLCDAGTYSGSGESECTPCANGTYASTPGLASCELADRGHYVSDDNRTTQISCPNGTLLSNGP